eukprot:TRINITY_DN2284_c0_g1_i1.p1 TRINITY_DN2284_c0_g1~~TRINITY_DN2284_c0_g1_i1.p1  ORF type:complete len:1025 (+),score=323.72 TRINITY_DN2284_c0_g1_i1:33-3107(+)
MGAQQGLRAAASADVARLQEEHSAVCDAVAELAAARKALGTRMETAAEVQAFADASLDLLREKVRAFRSVGKAAAPRAGLRKRLAAEEQGRRFGDGMAEVAVDGGIRDFYSGALYTEGVVATVKAALAGDSARYVVCQGCRGGILRANRDRHKRTCLHIDLDAHPDGRYEEMTAEWAVAEAAAHSPEWPFIGMYTLESPLCYDVHRRMRGYAFDGDVDGYAPVKNFAFRLHRELMSIPKYQGTVYRAVDFRVCESLYCEGALVTMPHQASASQDPAVVKRFLGRGGGGGQRTGSILILRTLSGRRIADFSRFPEEQEVLIPTNTQFRVVGRPDVGVMQLLECALEAELTNVAVAELQEVHFEDWGALRGILTEDERFHNKPVLEALDRWKRRHPDYEELRRSKITQQKRHILWPSTTCMPRVVAPDGTETAETLLELAAVIPENHAVVALMVANLDMTLSENAGAVQRALALAAARSHPRTTAALLSAGGRPADLPPALLTPRLALASVLSSASVVAAVQEVLGDVFWDPDPSMHHFTVVHLAADAGRADLIAAGGPLAGGPTRLNALDCDRETPLFTAVRAGRAGMVAALLAAGAEVDYRLPAAPGKVRKQGSEKARLARFVGERVLTTGRAAVLAAIDSVRLRAKECAAEARPPRDMQFSEGETAASAAAELGKPGCLGVLVDHGADLTLGCTHGTTPAHLASWKTDQSALECMQELARGGVDFNKLAEGNWNAGWAVVDNCCYNGHHACLRFLLEAGKADVNIRGEWVVELHGGRTHQLVGWTPLHSACNDGEVVCLRMLLRHGGLRGAVNHLGDTPLYWACRSGNVDCAAIMMQDPEGGATANTANAAGIAPLHVACSMGQADCVRLLLAHGVYTDAAAVPAAYAEPQTFWICKGEPGWTPAHFAAAGGEVYRRNGAYAGFEMHQGSHAACLSALRHAGADLVRRDAAGHTPLATAAAHGSGDCLAVLLDAAPAALDAPNARGETPCFLAAKNGHAACVAALLAAGADPARAAADGAAPA